MLFAQVKSLAYCIFTTIVTCQITPGIYTIRNIQSDPDVLAPIFPNSNDGPVIVRSLVQNPDQLAMWDVSLAPSEGFIIKNVKTQKFLSVNQEEPGSQVILNDNSTPWLIQRVGEGIESISLIGQDLYLSLRQGLNSVEIAPYEGTDSSQWDFIQA